MRSIAAEPALDEERAAQPDSGRVFAAAVAVPGPPTARFLGRLREPALHDRGAG